MGHEILKAQQNCVFTYNYTVFDLTQLTNQTGDYEYNYKWDGIDKTLRWNLCRNLVNECDGQGSYAAEFWHEKSAGDLCARLSFAQGNNTDNKEVQVKTMNTTQNKEESYLSISYTSDQECGQGKFGVTFETQCFPDMETPEFVYPDLSKDDCHPTIIIKSKQGCGVFSANALWRWCEANWWIIAIAMIAGGAFEWALGQKMFKPTLFIIGTFSVFALVMFFFYAWVLPYTTAKWTVWLIGSIGVILGLGVGFVLTKLARIGIAALGAWTGIVIGLIIHEAFMFSVHSQAVFWIMLIGCGAIFGALAFWKHKLVLMFATAFLGSYAMVRGLSLFTGGYPNEFTLISRIKEGDETLLHWPFYLFLVAIVALTVAGIIVQRKIRSRSSDDDKYDFYTKV